MSYTGLLKTKIPVGNTSYWHKEEKLFYTLNDKSFSFLKTTVVD
jgi:hypothetical protein